MSQNILSTKEALKIMVFFDVMAFFFYTAANIV